MTPARPRALLLSGLALAAVALAACSGGATVSPPSGEAPVATTTVDLPKSYRFAPATIEVPVGATVTWTNSDDFTHDITFDGDASLTMRPGETATRTFPATGTFAYLCSLHPREMQGSVTVVGS